MMHSGAAAREIARGAPSAEGNEAMLPDFDALYESYADFVWRNARRLGAAPASLDDVVQEVFLVAHRKLSELAEPKSLRAWMFSIVIRVVRDHRRSMHRKDPRQRSTTDPMDPEQLPAPHSHSPLATAEQSDAVRLLHRILAELDDKQREAFVLAELEELTEGEISEVLGENVNTVHSRLRAARKQFDQAVLRHRSRDEWRLG